MIFSMSISIGQLTKMNNGNQIYTKYNINVDYVIKWINSFDDW